MVLVCYHQLSLMWGIPFLLFQSQILDRVGLAQACPNDTSNYNINTNTYKVSIMGLHKDHLINPQFANNNIMNVSNNFRPSVVISCIVKYQVSCTCTM